MKVITLHPEPFRRACRDLAAQARDFAPDMLVGIATGGAFVASEMRSVLTQAAYTEVSLRRKATKRKKPLRALLRLLPTRLADALRRREAARVSFAEPEPFVLRPSLAATLRDCRRVLVADDAVDSGRTLLATVRAIREAAPQAEVRTAVLTVTTATPLINPDYALRRDETLIRFPWSLDYNPRR